MGAAFMHHSGIDLDKRSKVLFISPDKQRRVVFILNAVAESAMLRPINTFYFCVAITVFLFSYSTFCCSRVLRYSESPIPSGRSIPDNGF